MSHDEAAYEQRQRMLETLWVIQDQLERIEESLEGDE